MGNDLYVKLNEFLNNLFPKKHVTTKHEPVPWMNDEIKNNMQTRKMFYEWWLLNRKHQSADIIYGTFKKINNKIKYMIRDEKRESLVGKYIAAKTSREKWNLIHKYGITRKAQKNEARNTHFDRQFTVDNSAQ